MNTHRKWFTCTPVRFVGDHTFFARDSGLLCKGFQEIGIECKAIMPGPPMDVDLSADLIRTDYANLEDPAWWKSLGGEGVVFYGWGSGKYVRIVRAIKDAGLFLVSHMDTAGMLGVFNGSGEFSGMLWRTSTGEADNRLSGILRFMSRLVYGYTVGILKNDLPRARHLKQVDVIGAITPIACERIKKVCRTYGGAKLADKVRLIPHPNASYMAYSPSIPKERLVVAVGRWDDSKVKGTRLLAETVELALRKDPMLRVEIYGRPDAGLAAWHGSVPGDGCSRVRLMGVVPNVEVRMALQRARISLCTSLREGYHTVSAEALCCGASIVGPDVPEIPSMKWFADGFSGTRSTRDADSLAMAIAAEMAAWDGGLRDAMAISSRWVALLQAPRIAARIADYHRQDADATENRQSPDI